jgi:hypothetical protein
MQSLKLYVNFQNADSKGRIRLNCSGTTQDLTRQKIQLQNGLALVLYSDDTDASGNSDELRANGIVEFSAEEQIWVAVIDWSAIYHASDVASQSAMSANATPHT